MAIKSPIELAEEIRGIGSEIDEIEDGVESYSDVNAYFDRDELLRKGFMLGYNLCNIDIRLTSHTHVANNALENHRLEREDRLLYENILILIDNQRLRTSVLLSSLELYKKNMDTP